MKRIVVAMLFCGALCAEDLEIPSVAEPLASLSPEEMFLQEEVKRQVFLFNPVLKDHLEGLGVSYRWHQKNTFYDLELFQKRSAVYSVVVNKDELLDATKGEACFNNATFSKGFALHTRVTLYTLAGAGISYTTTSLGKILSNIYPILTAKAGLEFHYGFIDIGVNIPIPRFEYELLDYFVEDDGSVREITTKFTAHILPISRVGLGVTF